MSHKCKSKCALIVEVLGLDKPASTPHPNGTAKNGSGNNSFQLFVERHIVFRMRMFRSSLMESVEDKLLVKDSE